MARAAAKHLTEEQQEAVEALHAAEETLKGLGFHLAVHAALYSHKSVYVSTLFSTPEESEYADDDHFHSDAVHKISKEWFEAAHPDTAVTYRNRRYANRKKRPL